MADRNFQVGDFVRIRDWENMKDEFGISSGGNIPCNLTFTSDMKKYCGREFVISKITSSETVLGHGINGYRISSDMIEYADVSDFDDGCINDFLKEITIV